MKKTILEIYGMFVCLIVMICFSIALGTSLYSIVRIQFPKITLGTWSDPNLQTKQAFCANLNNDRTKSSECANKTDAEIIKMREDAFSIAIKTEQKSGTQQLLRALIDMFVSLIIFIPHWIIVRRNAMKPLE